MADSYLIPEFLRASSRSHIQQADRQPVERPILFSAPMVRALIDGTKTQTRRALKVQPLDVLPMKKDRTGREWIGLMQNPPEAKGVMFHCKFGVPGDRLWVREAHCFLDVRKSALSQFPLGPQNGNAVGPDVWNLDVEYSDGTEQEFSVEGDKPKQTRERGEYRWRPSIHMPRWASRILLEIVAVRVERLQDIGWDDALAEGLDVVCDGRTPYGVKGIASSWNKDPRESYRVLWESINGPGSWAANPWVWCITFKRVRP